MLGNISLKWKIQKRGIYWINRPTQEVSLWHVNYFKMKSIKALQANEKCLYSPNYPMTLLLKIRIFTRKILSELLIYISEQNHKLEKHLLSSMWVPSSLIVAQGPVPCLSPEYWSHVAFLSLDLPIYVGSLYKQN